MKNKPEQDLIDELFAAIENHADNLQRLIVTRLYTQPQLWHDVRNEQGETLLLACLRAGLTMPTNTLIGKGLDPQQWRNDLQNGLHLSANIFCALAVLNRSGIGLTLDADNQGRLPLHVHLGNEDDSIAKFLLSLDNASAQVVRKDAQGQTALFGASKNHPHLCWKMMVLGCDPRVKNNSAQTAQQMCTDPEIAKQMKAFCNYLDTCDAAQRESIIEQGAGQSNLQLAKKAKEFLQAQQLTSASVSSPT